MNLRWFVEWIESERMQSVETDGGSVEKRGSLV